MIGDTADKQNHTRDCVIMALKPRYAEQILNGEKDCEVRTYLGEVRDGDLVLVYASAPIKGIVGQFTAAQPVITTPNELMNTLTKACRKIPRDNMEYIQTHYTTPEPGRRILIVRVREPTKFAKPITIDTLRQVGVRIPRSYVRLTPEKCREILTTRKT